MANVNNLISKILEEAKIKEKEILANAQEEKNKIVDKRISEAKILEKEIIEKAKIEATTKKERIISSSQLKVRNDKLEAKQQIIQKTFDEAVESLANLSKEQFMQYVENKILSLDIYGDESLILNAKGKEMITSEFINDLNKKLTFKGKKGKITVKNETGDFKGGFILEKDGIEINNTFEALVNSIKEELEYEVAKVLFN
ncbi:V-type ATP synthase subunit E [Haloimpatiens massiliensis]|uniref:V-type ATP synthase subunit E n=1 Tax=Haloimpatiens massiliensis TaxID=1658110 RepID=UPI000C84A488|nr:V-type ATP synthase subunit E family protein [Haloimpatiens massiliensis]